MKWSLILTSLAAGGLALSMAACDQQEASDSSSVPMQQQGAVPSDQETMPTAPAESESQALEPQEDTGSDTMAPDAGATGTNQ